MYDYATERPFVFTEPGQLALIAAMNATRRAIQKAGACKGRIPFHAVIETGVASSFSAVAIVDRLVEMGFLFPVGCVGDSTLDAVFTAGKAFE